MNAATLDLLKKHEGFRATCYKDTRGFLTVGYGFNLDAANAPEDAKAAGLDYTSLRNGAAITETQAEAVLTLGATAAWKAAQQLVKGLDEMPETVQTAIVDMVFNMGAHAFSKFHKMIAAAEQHNWVTTAYEMILSKWRAEVGSRASDDIWLVLDARPQP